MVRAGFWLFLICAFTGCPDSLGERPQPPPVVAPGSDGGPTARPADAGQLGSVFSDGGSGTPGFGEDAGAPYETLDAGPEDAGSPDPEIDGCADNPCGAPATCVDQPEGAETEYLCDCFAGYEDAPDGGVGCADVDECLRGTHACKTGTSVCSNTPGGYSCVCLPGYTDYGDGCVGQACEGDFGCDDQDPCTQNACAFSGDGGLGNCFFSFEDADNDGVCDAEDNCVAVSNPDQTDMDGDSIGDFCDEDDDDADNDGVPDVADNCILDFNPAQADTDGDGTGDACNDDDDEDGDEYASALDCNDDDPDSTVVETDADCDGVLAGPALNCDALRVASVVGGFTSNSYSDARGVDKAYDGDLATSWRTLEDFQHLRLDLADAGMLTAIVVTATESFAPASLSAWVCPTNLDVFATDDCTQLAVVNGADWSAPVNVDFPPFYGQHVWLRNIEKTSSLYLELAEVQLQVLSCDNCTEVANPNQIDTDDDGEGNLCDMDDDDADNDETPDDADCLVGGEHSAASTVIAEDGDCDGHLNGDDKCPNKSHHDNSDFDDDGVGNVCDGDWDGDGVDNELECAPWDFAVTTLIVDDEDCDGVLNADDCLVDGSHRDDSTIRVEDADCDGVVTDEDCDDGEPGSTTKLGDPDCDGRCSVFPSLGCPETPYLEGEIVAGHASVERDPYIFSRAYDGDVETFWSSPQNATFVDVRFDLSEPQYVGRIGVTSFTHAFLASFEILGLPHDRIHR